MIVIGVDTHKRTHTLVVVDAGTGVTCRQRTIPASDAGVLDALRLAIELDDQRVWAIDVGDVEFRCVATRLGVRCDVTLGRANPSGAVLSVKRAGFDAPCRMV